MADAVATLTPGSAMSRVMRSRSLRVASTARDTLRITPAVLRS